MRGVRLRLVLGVVLVSVAACRPVPPHEGRQRAAEGRPPNPLPEASDASAGDVDDARPTAVSTARLDDAPLPAPPALRPPLGERACKELLAERRTLIARGTTRCTQDQDCGTYGDAKHPCGEGAIDQHTASEVERIDAQLLGDDCYLRRTGTCHITPYGFRPTCASNGRCGVK